MFIYSILRLLLFFCFQRYRCSMRFFKSSHCLLNSTIPYFTIFLHNIHYRYCIVRFFQLICEPIKLVLCTIHSRLAFCLSLVGSGTRPLFPQWTHHVYPQFLPGGHPAHRHPHTHCKLECGQHINNNTHAHTRIASYHRAHAGNAAVDVDEAFA